MSLSEAPERLLPDLSQMSGIEILRAMVAAQAGAPIARTLGFTLTEIDDGRVVFEGTPTRSVYNPIGSVHGGYAATLLDSACGCAVHSKLAPGWAYTTLELKVAYHRAMTVDTGPVRAEGRVVTMGRRAAFTEATLTDAAGKLYATATSSLLVMAPG